MNDTTQKDSSSLFSYHTFMFPFTFSCPNNEITKSWELKPYVEKYNEITYFHPFFKKSMLTKTESESSAFYTKKEVKN
ncbi:MAG: hypothetical protein J0647_05540, partial [Campylobacteraceae bacterium]|nr:hypothetical protein [Campylobacteraceae bacterium]